MRRCHGRDLLLDSNNYGSLCLVQLHAQACAAGLSLGLTKFGPTIMPYARCCLGVILPSDPCWLNPDMQFIIHN